MQVNKPLVASFKILGPLEVSGPDGPIDLGKTRPREVLVHLVMSANRVVSATRLIELLWGETPPQQATATLHTYIAQLRRSLAVLPGGENRLETRRPGYVLNVDPAESDDAQFTEATAVGQRLFSAGDFAGASRYLRTGLALCRGPVFAEFATSIALTREAALFEDRRLDVLEACMEAELAVGDRSLVLTELVRLVAENPLRERLRGVYMLALYRSGRQADALRAFQDFRQVMGEELGLEPGPVLRRLEAKILRQDEALELEPLALGGGESSGDPKLWGGPGIPEQLLGVPRSPFIGRGYPLRTLLDRWASTRGGRASLVAVAGEPGIGKTRLAAEFCRLATSDEGGAIVLYGRCTEDVVIPYQPFAEALDRYIRSAPDALLAQQVLLPEALAAVVPAVAYRLSLAGDVGADTRPKDINRVALFDAVSDMLSAVSEHRAVIFVLDDLQWADQSTVSMLGHALRRYPDRRMMVVAIYRGGEVPIDHPLNALLVDARRRHDAHIVNLVGLDPDETAALAGAWIGKRPAETFVKSLHADSEGNPYFVEELLRSHDEASLAGQNAWRASNDARMGLPESIDDVLRRRLRRLSEPTYQLLSVGAIAGREFSLDVLEQITSRQSVELAEMLEEAITAHLVREIPDSFGKYVFAHGLVQHVLADAMSASRRALVHGRMLGILENRRTESTYDALAHHALESVQVVGADRAAEHVERAARRSMLLLASKESLDLLNRALARINREAPAARAGLLLTRNEVLWSTGDSATATAGAIEAWDLARAVNDPQLIGRAALSRMWLMSPDKVAEAVKFAEAGLRALGDTPSPVHCMLLGALSAKLALTPDRDRAVDVSRRALAMARELNDPLLVASCLDDSEVLWCAATMAERTEFVREMYEIGHATGRFGVTLNALHWDIVLAIECADRESLAAILDRQLHLAHQANDARGLAGGAQKEAMVALIEGRYDDALACAARAIEFNSHPDYEIGGRVQTFLAMRDRGLAHTLESAIRDIVSDQPALADWNTALAMVLADMGHEAELRELLDRLQADDYGIFPRSFAWLATLCWLTESAAQCGTFDQTQRLRDMLEGHRGQCASMMTIAWAGSVSHYLGVAAAALGEFDRAEELFVEAIGVHDAMQSPPFVARSKMGYAGVLIRRGASEDLENAKSLARDVRAIAQELGMAGLESQAQQLLKLVAVS